MKKGISVIFLFYFALSCVQVLYGAPLDLKCEKIKCTSYVKDFTDFIVE